jgi:hypothetical protein
MATPRKCAGFEAYAGTELACWNFMNSTTRDAAVAWAGLQMNTTTKNCWKGVGVELQGGDGVASGACDLRLTSFVDDHRNAAASLNAQIYGSITIAVNYRTAGSPSTAIATLNVTRDSMNETKLGDLTDKDSIGVVGFGLPVPALTNDEYQRIALNLLFRRPANDNRIFIQSVIVLGIPR